MKYAFLGGAGEVGASCLLIKVADCNILIDCGIRVNKTHKEAFPDFQVLKEIAPRLDLIFLSHAHADHIGALPLLHQLYPETYIITPKTTADLTLVMLSSMASLTFSDLLPQEEGNVCGFTQEDIKKAYSMVRIADPDPMQPDRWRSLWTHRWGVKFIPSGHILGAMSIALRTPEGIFLYTGDVSAFNQRTVDGIGNKLAGINPDLMWCEATYGESNHPARKKEEQNLAKAVAAIIKDGGSVLIPSFALGRAQEIILILVTAMQSGNIPVFPIFTDGLVNKICSVYEDNIKFTSKRFQAWARQNPEMFSRPPIVPVRKDGRSTVMMDDTPKCIIASSGMLTGGVSVAYAKFLAKDPKNAIFLSGYQDAESPGAYLQSLHQGDRLSFRDGSSIQVNCKVHQFHLSAHSDQTQLIKMIKQANPKEIALAHGSRTATETLAEKLSKDFSAVTVAKNCNLYEAAFTKLHYPDE